MHSLDRVTHNTAEILFTAENLHYHSLIGGITVAVILAGILKWGSSQLRDM